MGIREYGAFTDNDAVRFMGKVQLAGTCWIWLAGTFRDGYGQFRLNGCSRRAHCISWLIHRGPIPDRIIGRDGIEADALVLHNCPDGDNYLCFNPGHLWLGTQADNMADKVAKHRQAIGMQNGAHTHPERRPRGERQGSAKLTESAFRTILASSLPGTQLAAQFGVTRSLVSQLRCGVGWAHIPRAKEKAV